MMALRGFRWVRKFAYIITLYLMYFENLFFINYK